MKLKFIQPFIVILFFISCKQNKKSDDFLIIKEKKIKTSKLIKQEVLLTTKNIHNFDLYLINNDEIFYPEEGLLAYERNEDIGKVSIYFFNKKGALKWQKKMNDFSEEEVNKELNRIQNLSLKEFKKEFTIYAFLIDKLYLQNTPEGMYQKETYVKNLYKYEDNSKLWISVDSFAVKIKDDFLKEREWSKRKLRELIN